MTQKLQCGIVAVCTSLLGGMLLAGCPAPSSKVVAEPTPFSPPKPPTAEQAKLRDKIKKDGASDGEADFAFHLLQKVAATSPKDNMFLSPFSASQAVLLAANGTTGSTQAGFLKSLGLPETDIAGVNAEKQELLAMLQPVWEEENGKKGPAYEWTAANAIWSKVAPKPSFVQLCGDFYGAQAYPLTDADTINGWASKQTRGRITHVVDPQTIAVADLIITNAVYFKGRWVTPFKPEDTHQGLFHLADGKTREQLLMHYTDTDMQWYQGQNFEAVSLPYRGDMNMVILLPLKDYTAKQVLESLSADTWKKMRQGLGPTWVALTLPTFEIESGGSLLEPMKEMGMPTEGDFSIIADQFGKASITDIVQSTFLRVDEKGTEAAAVTAVTEATSALPTEPLIPVHPFVVDKPFLCAIVHRDTGTILFAGIINDPKPIP